MKERVVFSGRRNGKYLFLQKLNKSCLSKKYKPFKEIKKELNNIYISYDLSNGKDHSVKITIMHHKDTLTVLNVEVMD